MRQSLGYVDQADGLVEAERQIEELEVDLFGRLMKGVAAHVPKGLTADERRHVIGGLIAASPELREVAQRLETLSSFAAVAEPVRSWV
jgi:hypothetical protein